MAIVLQFPIRKSSPANEVAVLADAAEPADCSEILPSSLRDRVLEITQSLEAIQTYLAERSLSSDPSSMN